MANSQFDAKSFNPQAFGYMVERVPNTQMNEIKKSKVLRGNADIKAAFSMDGTTYARLARRGFLEGEAVNYDGMTDIDASATKTYEQGAVVIGRAKAWVERDFSYDITNQTDFMQNVADGVAEYKDTLDQKTILAILEGLFNMDSDEKNLEFVEKHTYDITAREDGILDATSLNSAVCKACGDRKKKFTTVFLHSQVATGLENLNLIEHLKYTGADGITRDLDLGTWNGKLVVIDDSMPVQQFFDEDDGELLYTEYTSYVLGDGAINYEELDVRVPYEIARDPAKNGGEDTLYMRQRKVFAPYGISYEKKMQRSLSPMLDELRDGTNWTLAHSGEADYKDRSYIDHKSIPIARIISRG